MELRQLRYFIAVAEELSFSRGAKRAGISQPPLSRHIAALETELGTRLLNRTNHSVSLTETGKVFFAEAGKALAAVRRTAEATQSAAKGQSGSLSLGFGGSVSYTFGPRLLQRFHRLYPDVELVLHSLPGPAQLEALRAKTIDVGFAFSPLHDTSLRSKVALRDHLVVALPSGHSLSRKSRISLRDLSPYGFIVFPPAHSAGYHSHFMSTCERAGFTPRIVQEAHTMESLIGFVAAGVGIAVVPSVVGQRLRVDSIAYRPLNERYARVNYVVAYRKDNSSPVVAAFVGLIGRRR